MKKRLELSDGSSHKFWEVEVAGATMTVTSGKIGTDGQAKPNTFSSAAEATEEAEKLVAETTKKGYAEAGAAAKTDAPADPAALASSAGSASILPPKLVELIGGSCYRLIAEKEEEDVVVFDWWALPAAFRDELLGDVFNNCLIPGDFPALLGRPSSEIEWINRACVPFALAGVQSGTDMLGTAGIPQFHRLLLIDAAGAAHAIAVDGTAAPAKEPEKIATSWEALTIKKRTPVKPVVDGALPKVKTSKHVRLIGSWGQFVPPAKDPTMVRDIQLSADAQLAVLAIRSDRGEQQGARVVRVETGELVRHLGTDHGGIAISPDGSQVVTTHGIYEGGRVHIGTCWDVATGEQRWAKPIQRGDSMVTLQISPDGDTLFASSAGNGIKVYGLADGALRWEQEIGRGQFDNHAHAMAFSSTGALATAGADGVIRIWDPKKRAVTKSIKDENAIEDIAWLPDGTRLVSHSSHVTAIWDVPAGTLIKKLREWDRGRTAADIAISPAGFLVGCTTDGKIDIWNLDGGVVERIDLKGKVGAWCLAPCPDGFVVGTSGACALRFALTP